jgi:hypothetical protein
MKDWIASKFRAGRFSMNLTLLKTDLDVANTAHCAAVITAAAAMVEQVSQDDFISGTLLSRAVTEPFAVTPEQALQFYNTLEDVLTAAESQRKQAINNAASILGFDGAKKLDQQLQIQQQGMRLLMVALARNTDESFKSKARVLRDKLYDSKDSIKQAISAMKEQDAMSTSAKIKSADRNYESIEITASLLAFAVVGW